MLTAAFVGLVFGLAMVSAVQAQPAQPNFVIFPYAIVHLSLAPVAQLDSMSSVALAQVEA